MSPWQQWSYEWIQGGKATWTRVIENLKGPGKPCPFLGIVHLCFHAAWWESRWKQTSLDMLPCWQVEHVGSSFWPPQNRSFPVTPRTSSSYSTACNSITLATCNSNVERCSKSGYKLNDSVDSVCQSIWWSKENEQLCNEGLRPELCPYVHSMKPVCAEGQHTKDCSSKPEATRHVNLYHSVVSKTLATHPHVCKRLQAINMMTQT